MLGFINKLFISVQLIVFLDHVLLLAELAQNSNYFKIAVWRSDSMTRKFGGFTFTKVNDLYFAKDFSMKQKKSNSHIVFPALQVEFI